MRRNVDLNKFTYSFYFVAFIFMLQGPLALAQHPIEVERLSIAGEHLNALVTFDKIPARRLTSSSILAAAKSAWALGLTDRAIKEYERALRDPSLTPQKRAQVLLSRGAIEFQEAHYQVSTLFAEKAVELLREPSPLRASIWRLWGDGLSALGQFGAAEEKLLKAQQEVSNEEASNAAFSLAECQLHLGKLEEARQNFEKVPLRHERTPAAIRSLAQIAMEQRHYTQAAFWLNKGREEYPDAFLDSWVDYALIQVAIHDRDPQKVKELSDMADKKYPPSDQWLIMLHATVEGFFWTESRQAGGLATTKAS